MTQRQRPLEKMLAVVSFRIIAVAKASSSARVGAVASAKTPVTD